MALGVDVRVSTDESLMLQKMLWLEPLTGVCLCLFVCLAVSVRPSIYLCVVLKAPSPAQQLLAQSHPHLVGLGQQTGGAAGGSGPGERISYYK